MLLLTDGSIMAQDYTNGSCSAKWYRLQPDSTGSYVNGTWSALASMSTGRLFFASVMLPSGKVFAGMVMLTFPLATAAAGEVYPFEVMVTVPVGAFNPATVERVIATSSDWLTLIVVAAGSIFNVVWPARTVTELAPETGDAA